MKNFRQFLKEAVGDTVGIMYGRFNPPHRGHRAAWEMASENDNWFVGTNQSTQGKKDPLPYNVKIKAMEAVWPEVASHIVPETNLFTLATKVYNELGEVNAVIYTDEDWLTKTLEKYNGVEGKHGYYKFANIQQKPTPRLSSATDVRNAVLAGDREAFEQAAGVSADHLVDGKPYFELVAEYLLPFHTKESQSDKYKEQLNIKESIMNLNELRQLAGLPLSESAPVQFKGGQASMSDADKKLADIGRILMDMSIKEKDDVLANAMSELGGKLADGSIKSAENLISFVKSSSDPAALSDRATAAMSAYNSGDRAVGLKPGEQPEDDFVEPSEEDMMDSVDLSEFYADDEIDESGADEPTVGQMSDQELADYIGSSVEEVKADRAAAEDAAHEKASGHYESQDFNEADLDWNDYFDNDREAGGDDEDDAPTWDRSSDEDEFELDSYEPYDDETMGGEVDFDDDHEDEGDSEIASRRDRMRKAKAAGGKYATQEAVEETAQNAMDAAMAELRKLAGL